MFRIRVFTGNYYFCDKFAITIKFFDCGLLTTSWVSLGIIYVYVIEFISSYVFLMTELVRTATLGSPHQNRIAISVKFLDTLISSFSDVQITLRIEYNTGRYIQLARCVAKTSKALYEGAINVKFLDSMIV